MRRILFSVIPLLLAACNTYNYPHKPTQQPLLAPMFAKVVDSAGDYLDFYIDTHGRKLLGASIYPPNAMPISADDIVYPKFKADTIGGPMEGEDPRYGAEMAQGPTIARFKKAALGAPPYRLALWVQGVGYVYFNIP